MKNRILIWVLIIIIIVLGFIVLFKNSKNAVAPTTPTEESQNIGDISTTNIKTYTDSNTGYSVSYPSSWVRVSSTGKDIFQIKNSSTATLNGANSEMGIKDSTIAVLISDDNFPKGMNYEEFSTIDELIKDPRFGLSIQEQETRLSKVVNLKIDGKDLRASRMSNSTSESYSFIYADKVYGLTFMAGSEAQYNLDHKIFTDLISSFKFTSTSVGNENSTSEVFSNQPGAIKSIIANGTNRWLLVVDLLTINTKWLPGVNDPFVNQNTKIRNLNVTTNTKTYNCGAGPDGNDTTADVLISTSNFVTNLQNKITQRKSDLKYRIGGPIEIMTDWIVSSFDIDGTNITAIYEKCLP